MKGTLSRWERALGIRTKSGTRVVFVAIVNDGSACPLIVRIGETMHAYPLSGKYTGVLPASIFDKDGDLDSMDLVIENKSQYQGGYPHGNYDSAEATRLLKHYLK